MSKIKQPTLSIIIPVFQAENYLKSCIDSVLSQSFTDFELLLIDDGSTDQSGRICDYYENKDKRIKVIHQDNRGQSAARNIGINLSTGKYIGFVDNDDIVYPSMFEILIKNMEENDSDISSCSFNQKNEKGEFQHTDHDGQIHVLSNFEGMKALLSRAKLDIYVWTKLYKKKFLEQYSIRFEENKNDEDMLFNYKSFSFSQKTVFQDIPLYLYMHRESSASRILPKKSLLKYLSGTLYRVNLIERETKRNYPTLHYLAIRQKIVYSIQMISKIVTFYSDESDEYYNEIMTFLKSHRMEVFRNKRAIGLKYIGIILLLFMPNDLYLDYKRLKSRLMS